MSRLWILSLCATIALVGGVSRGAVLANFDEPLGDSGWRVQGPSWCELQLAYEQEEVGGIDTVFITIYKTFRYGPDSFGRFPGIELSFRQMDGVPTEELATRIVIESEIIENATGSDWYDYHWKLFGCSAASFNQEMTNPTTDPDEEGWYIDPFTRADWIIDEVFGTEELALSEGVVLDGDAFFPGTTPGGLVIDIDLDNVPCQPPITFGLWQAPTPEPATLALVVLGGVVVIRQRRRS